MNILDLCRGQKCQLAIPNVCRDHHDTVVPCHSPDSNRRHGKGYGLKPSDIFSVPGCRECHDYIDQRSDSRVPIMNTSRERQDFFDAGHARWMIHLFNTGRLIVADNKTLKQIEMEGL